MINMNAVNQEIMAAHAELESKDNTKGILSLGTRTRIWNAMLDPTRPRLLGPSLS